MLQRALQARSYEKLSLIMAIHMLKNSALVDTFLRRDADTRFAYSRAFVNRQSFTGRPNHLDGSREL
jgi:hypothetical protein